MNKEVLVEIKNLTKAYSKNGSKYHAIENINLNIFKGETLGIVGESGSGKTTLGKTVLRLLKPDSGEINFNGKNITHLNDYQLKSVRKEMQMIFQDPFSSLNKNMTIKELILEPMIIHNIGSKTEREAKVMYLLEKVGLPFSCLNKYPEGFSGGQLQRVGIARALSIEPKLIIGDEPVSALDVSVEAQVLNLMKDLQRELMLTYLFISHDLSVVYHMSDRVAVLYLGHLVELAPKEKLFENPIHPYTKSLISSVPVTNPLFRNTSQVDISLPDRHNEAPCLVEVDEGHFVAQEVLK